jgi:hypothetical protein
MRVGVGGTIASIKSLVSGVTNEALPICTTQSTAFLGGEKLLLEFSGERMKALRVHLSDEGSQLQGAGLA